MQITSAKREEGARERGVLFSMVSMRNILLELTLITLCALFVFVVANKLDVLEAIVDFSRRYEAWEIDELVTVALFLVFAGGVFAFRRLRESKVARELVEQRNRDLEDSMARVKTLEGILPICGYCKKIRTEGGSASGPQSWVPVEAYVRNHTDADFSHGICPDCMQKFHAEE